MGTIFSVGLSLGFKVNITALVDARINPLWKLAESKLYNLKRCGIINLGQSEWGRLLWMTKRKPR